MESFDNFYDGSERFESETSDYWISYPPQVVSQDVVASYDVSLQDTTYAEPCWYQKTSMITSPDVYFQQDEYMPTPIPSVQHDPTTYNIEPFLCHPQQYRAGKLYSINKEKASWYHEPIFLDTAPQGNGAPSNFIPNMKGRGGDTIQATFPVIDGPSTKLVQCFNCKVTRTPLWRRTPDREHPLCNACGLYYKQYGRDRPSPRSRQRSKVALQQSQTPEKEPLRCVNCNQTETPLWRKNSNNEAICNACGLYAKLHHRNRPVSMGKSKYQRRNRHIWSSYYDGDDSSEAAIAVTKALSSSISHNGNVDSDYISQVKDMGTKDAVQDALEVVRRRYNFLETVLSFMENGDHIEETQYT